MPSRTDTRAGPCDSPAVVKRSAVMGGSLIGRQVSTARAGARNDSAGARENPCLGSPPALPRSCAHALLGLPQTDSSSTARRERLVHRDHDDAGGGGADEDEAAVGADGGLDRADDRVADLDLADLLIAVGI